MKELAACLAVAVALAGCGPDRQRCEALSDKIAKNTSDLLTYEATGTAALRSGDLDAAEAILVRMERAAELALDAEAEFVALGC